jgi:hypothetical protein
VEYPGYSLEYFDARYEQSGGMRRTYICDQGLALNNRGEEKRSKKREKSKSD